MKNFVYLVALVLVINSIILGKVFYNRNNEVITLELSERELTIPYRFSIDRESTQAKLNLKWRAINSRDDKVVYRYWSERQLDLPLVKIKSLGFEVNDKHKRFFENPSKELYWLVEFNGEKYKGHLEQLKQQLVHLKTIEPNKKTLSQQELNKKIERQEERIQKELSNKSRLIVVDVSDENNFDLGNNDLKRANYLVVKGLARVYYDYSNVKDKGAPKVSLYLERMLVSQIHLPKEKITAFPLQRDHDKEFQYQITVSWGKLLEPWVKHVDFLE